ncbi:hypothetical protein JB92DRAFT_2748165 [Gautieria morchelliformis]|nr:hypothetical protein JB92DRAFT_2748165 [Gautieria morchelliformis]
MINPSPATARRRPPPPPPQRLPVKNPSLPPVALAHYRPAPLPPNARKRYDALFERNLPQNPRKGRASGWRGLSVDLLTNGEKSNFMEDSSREERLDGSVIKSIWSCSKLPRVRLREIWMECDPDGLGSLDRDAFAKGMWRIDELLSRAHQQLPKATLLSSNSIPLSYAPRAPPAPLRKPTFLLR